MVSSIKTAFILAAGLGTRLRPLTHTCPKPLLPVKGRPLITYAMDHLLTIGVKQFIINTHHCAEVYHQVFPEGQWKKIPIRFRHEPVLLDTAGGIKNIEDLLEDNESLLVYNGDIISTLPLHRLIHEHFTRKREVTLALRTKGSPLNVNITADGDVCDLRHTLGNPGVQSCLFTGIYIIERPFFNRLQAGRPESVIDVFLKMIGERPGSLTGVIIDEGSWYDIGSLEEYEKMNRSDTPSRDEKCE